MYTTSTKATWAHIDANGHLRNTAYSEFATHARLQFFDDHGFPPKELAANNIGPVMTREELLYYREVHMMENLKVSCQLSKATKDYSRFQFVQYIFKENGKKAAKITLEGLWLNLQLRKTAIPPQALIDVCAQIPKTDDFEWLDKQVRS